MAYRRRQGITKSSTFEEEPHHRPSLSESQGLLEYAAATVTATAKPKLTPSHTFNSSSTLAADAIRASTSHRSQFGSHSPIRSNKIFDAYEDRSPMSGSKGFWGVLARKAKPIMEDEEEQDANNNNKDDTIFGASPRPVSPAATSRFQMSPSDTSTPAAAGIHQLHSTSDGLERKIDNPAIKNRLDKIKTSLNHIGDTFDKAFEEGRTMVENKTADIIQETRKLQARRKGGAGPHQNQQQNPSSQPEKHMNPETQLKASRDVAMATAAKAKLLLRELKTVKADLAFAKQRCSQLEEENKILRDSREKGGNPADDDLIRLQLETLLAEKARLANENAFYARENCYLREIVEYHQLTMQDVVYLDESGEEVSEVDPISNLMTMSPPLTPPSPSASGMIPTATESFEEAFPVIDDDVARIPDTPATGKKGTKSDKEDAEGITALVIQEEQTPKVMSLSTT
ncbi:unnamed protein product [Linum trigynum]|uniref:Uncharacterized protein n=1 Tax=Linum trigynum TaxID=586398 RepID=A0AAV2DGX5_9ROSI